MIIYPLVEESQKLDLAAAVDAHEKLDENIFPDLNVGLVHGRMKSEEKEKAMLDFSNNKIFSIKRKNDAQIELANENEIIISASSPNFMVNVNGFGKISEEDVFIKPEVRR